MTTRRRRAIRFFLLPLTGVVVVAGLWLCAQRHQYVLDRQLIAEIDKQDYNQAGNLVREGADPNTLFYPPPLPSPRELWNHHPDLVVLLQRLGAKK